MGTGEKLVTKSDEAFALLVYKNYIGKWKKQGNIKDDEDEQHEEDDDEDGQHEEDKETAQSVTRKNKSNKAVRGKYTIHNNGTTKYGGWSGKGMAQFNELYELVRVDRKCPQAAAMEKEFLERAIFEACDSKRARK
jgi:hypothetical protein